MTKQELDELKAYFRSSSHNDEIHESFYIHAIWPNTTNDINRILYYDKSVAKQIENMQNKIEALKKLRCLYAERYNELYSMRSVPVVKLIRSCDYSTHRVTYTILTCRRLDDGSEIETKRTAYEGKNRKQAFEDFDKYVKEHPGITAIKDIEKKSWER